MRLKRELGIWDVIATIFTIVIGGGIFLAAVHVQGEILIGSNIIWAYLIAAIPALLVAISYAILSSALPFTGGEYYFISRIFDPYLGFIMTWIRWFGMIASTAAISIGSIELLKIFFAELGKENIASVITSNNIALAIFIVLFFFIINYFGLKIFSSVQKVLFSMLMVGLVAYIVIGIPRIDLTIFAASARGDFLDIITAASIIFFAYLGFSVVSDVAGEIRNPQKTIPGAIIISLLVISGLYMVVSLVTYSVLPLDQVIASENVAGVAGKMVSPFFGIIISFVAFIALISNINPNMLATSRIGYAWAKDHVIPPVFTKLNHHHAPAWTLLINSTLACLIIYFFHDFIGAIKLTSITVLISYFVVCTTCFLFHIKSPHLFERSEFKFKYYWLISLGGMFTTATLCLLLIRDSSMSFFFILIWALIGSIVYFYDEEHGGKKIRHLG